MFATHVRGKSRARLLSLALVGGMALGATTASTEVLTAINPGSSSAGMARPSVAATTSVTTSAPQGGVGTVQVAALVLRTGTTSRTTRSTRTARSSRLARPSRAYMSSWSAVPGYRSYRMHDFRGDPFAASFGQCTWYAWYRHRKLPLMQLGNAGQWPAHASRYGLRVSSRPVDGATVVFAPGVQGASRVGHAGVVERVLSGGWVEISEMNFYWNGGGWGKVDYRYVHVGPGVSFIL